MSPSRSAVGAFSLFLIMLCVSVARGDGLGELRAGIAAYDAGDLHRAVPILRAATRSPLAPRERARAWLYLGLTLASLEGPAAGRDAFLAALREDGDLEVERERIPPAVMEEIERTRRAVVGELQVECDEPGARVLVAGQERGRAPLSLRMPVGRHDIRVISTDGYRVYEAKAVLVSARRQASIRAHLVPRRGRLRLALSPASARVYDGDRVLPTSSGTAFSLSAGAHRLVLRAPGHVPEARELVVEPETETELRMTLGRTPRPWYAKRRVWGWVSVGAAVGLTTAALVLGSAAQAAASTLSTAERDQTLTAHRYADLSATIDGRARAANAFFGVGGAAALTGLVLILVGDRAAPDDRRRSWRVSPTSSGLSFSAHF